MLNHTVYLWNHLPSPETGILPIAVYTGKVITNYDFLKIVFGYSAYVLDPKSKDGKKFPKWLRITHCGRYLGV
jgi:hypothetical protein